MFNNSISIRLFRLDLKNYTICSINCKNVYHIRLRQVTKSVTTDVDKILHRNRSILLELVGKSRDQIKVSRMLLDQKKFNFDYVTGFHVNVQKKMVHHVYDFSWLIFSDEEVLIYKKYHR